MASGVGDEVIKLLVGRFLHRHKRVDVQDSPGPAALTRPEAVLSWVGDTESTGTSRSVSNPPTGTPNVPRRNSRGPGWGCGRYGEGS